MEKIDRKAFEEILITNGYDLTLLTNADGKISIKKNICITVRDGNCVCKCTGYTVTGDKEEKAKTLDELYALLNKIGAGDGEYVLDNIDGQFATVVEMRDKIDFDNISMDGLLERYKEADRFSLTADYGDVHIDKETAKTVLKEISGEMYKLAESQYLLISEEERQKLPPFDKLFKEITDECIAHRKKRTELIKKYSGNSAFCDVFAMGKGKYKAPQELWHIYSAADFIQTCAYILERLQENKEVAPIDRQIDGLPVLKVALISAKPTFCWHCTTSGSLATVFTFELNDSTKAWLKTHKDDYDFGITQKGYRLDDLAFYRGDKILFSSCTHEHFHSDCPNG